MITMKAILFSMLLLVLGAALPAADPKPAETFWYQIFLTEGNSVSSFTGSSDYEWSMLESVIKQGGLIRLENLRELALTDPTKPAAWRAVDEEAEMLNAKCVTHITQLKGDPLKTVEKK